MKKLSFILAGLISLLVFMQVVYTDQVLTVQTQTLYHIYSSNNLIGTIDDVTAFKKAVEVERLGLEIEYGKVYEPTNYEIVSEKISGDYVYDSKQTISDYLKIANYRVDGYEVVLDNQAKLVEDTVETAKITQEEIKFSVTDKKIMEEGLQEYLYLYVDPEDYIKIVNDAKFTFPDLDDTTTVDYFAFGEIKYIEKKVDINDLYDSPEDVASLLLFGENKEYVEYVVDKDDTLATIAFDHNMSINQLVVANDNLTSQNTLLAVGMSLNVAKPSPVINVLTEEYVTLENNIAYKVEFIDDPTMNMGTSKIVNPGQYGKSVVTYKIQYYNGESTANSSIVSEEIVTQPVNRVIKRGIRAGTSSISQIGYYEGNDIALPATNVWIRPIVGGYISSWFGYRSLGDFHTGLDYAGLPLNTPALAADNGTVINAGYKGTGGNMVYIDHGNGYETRYAHCNVIYVQINQPVLQGEPVCGIGDTGLAYGVHLHFEVFPAGGDGSNKGAIDPALYPIFAI